jgi:hypothetical protein
MTRKIEDGAREPRTHYLKQLGGKVVIVVTFVVL